MGGRGAAGGWEVRGGRRDGLARMRFLPSAVRLGGLPSACRRLRAGVCCLHAGVCCLRPGICPPRPSAVAGLDPHLLEPRAADSTARTRDGIWG